MRTQRDGSRGVGGAEGGGCFLPGPHRAYAHVLVAEALEPLVAAASCESRGQLGCERVLIRAVLAIREVGPVDELAEAAEELRLERADGQLTPVRGLVDAVAGEAACEHPPHGLASEPVSDEVVGAVRHRDDDMCAHSGPLACEKRCEHPCHGSERAGCEVGDLNRGKPGRGVCEHAGPAEVVDVVSRSRPMGAVVPEAGDRAVDDGVGDVVGSDPESLGDTRSEPLEDDVGTGAQSLREGRIGLEVADDRLAACPQGRVPCGRGRAHRVPVRRLDSHDSRAQPRQLSARIRTWEVAREVDDEDAVQRLHGAGAYLYPRAALTDDSIAHREKRKLILDAAIRVFADRGYHGARVGDIAEHAGVAHGLLYHYFASKDDVLRAIFTENWGELIARFRAVEASDSPADEKLEGVAKILLRTWRNNPALVTVMVREVARSHQLSDRVDEVREAFAIVQRVIEEGQAAGAFRRDLDARLASWLFYGGLEEVLTGWVLGQLPDSEENVTQAERTAVALALGGLRA